ncbi:phosphoribosylglycinamide formyltransferase [Kistimonas scapharcae]|uniref:Phosphoribosylglycinamide formyltransferase n=1 Tax=Kistimonas scapharcae TaxID=1036133 RepID=A0ABP8V0Y9_9GAMM
MTRNVLSVVVLVSGNGSNLQTLIDQQADLGIRISAVVSNRDDAYGLVRAREAGIPTITLNHQQYADREVYDAALIQQMDQHNPELVVLAGFMRILTPTFTRHYHGRMLNIHPSLLPKYKGLHTHRRALEAGDTEHGVTVHFVTEELDGGSPVIQARVPITDTDTEDTLQQRVHAQEYRIYPQAVAWFAEGRLKLINNQAFLDDAALPVTGYDYPVEETAELS